MAALSCFASGEGLLCPYLAPSLRKLQERIHSAYVI